MRARKTITPFDGFDLTKSQSAIDNALPETFETTEAFFEGDHWQKGAGWIGPTPDLDKPDLVETIEAAIETSFVSKNVIRETVKRHVRGVVGREPVWTFDVRRALKPDEKRSAKEEALISELNAAVDTWMREKKVHKKLRESMSIACRGGKGILRLYIPSGLIVTKNDITGIPRAATIDDALASIYVDAPNLDSATVFVDQETQSQLGVFIYSPVDPVTLQPLGDKVVELTYLDGTQPSSKAQTVIRRLTKDEDSKVKYKLGGRITIIEIDRDEPLIDEQVHQSQRALNLALSMIPRTMVTAGFLERIFLDAQMPGEWKYDEKGNRIPGSFTPGKFVTGAGSTSFVSGIDYEKTMEEQAVKDPKVVWREPVDPSGAIKAAQFHYLTLLEETNQAHIVLTGEAIVSGKSREQARADYDSSLHDSKIPGEQAGIKLLETAVAWAEALMGRPGYYTSKLRAVFRYHIYTGPVSWEERKQNDESVTAGTMSRSTAIQQSGIADADAETAQILSERENNDAHIERMAKSFLQYSQGGMPPAEAAELVGISGAMLAKIQTAIEAIPVDTGSGDPNAGGGQ